MENESPDEIYARSMATWEKSMSQYDWKWRIGFVLQILELTALAYLVGWK